MRTRQASPFLASVLTRCRWWVLIYPLSSLPSKTCAPTSFLLAERVGVTDLADSVVSNEYSPAS